MHFLSIPIIFRLKELGIDDKSEFLKQVNGPALLQISQVKVFEKQSRMEKMMMV